MLIVLIDNSKQWRGTSSAEPRRLCTESKVKNGSTCPAEPRDEGGPVADMWRVNKLVGPRRVGRSWTFAHSADVNGRQNVYVSLLPCWGDFVTFICWEKFSSPTTFIPSSTQSAQARCVWRAKTIHSEALKCLVYGFCVCNMKFSAAAATNVKNEGFVFPSSQWTRGAFCFMLLQMYRTLFTAH